MNDLLNVPAGYALVSTAPHMRNGQMVTVKRYQLDGEYVEFGPRLIVIETKSGELVSVLNLTRSDFVGDFPKQSALVDQASDVWEEVLPEYAVGLTFLRIDRLTRSFVVDGVTKSFPVRWVKFGHNNGTYNWVTFAADGTVIEIERESAWDYARGRRATEMWDSDEWVRAYEKRGPEMAAPAALTYSWTKRGRTLLKKAGAAVGRFFKA